MFPSHLEVIASTDADDWLSLQRQLNQEPISHRTSLALTSHQASPDTTGSSADVEGEEEGDAAGDATRSRPTGTAVAGTSAAAKAGKGKKRAPDELEDEGDGKKRKFVPPLQSQPPRPTGNGERS